VQPVNNERVNRRLPAPPLGDERCYSAEDMIEQAGLTQQAAAEKMGVSQPDVSNLLRGRFEGFSLERLLGFVRALGSDVEIKVKRRRDREHGEGRLSLMVA
jgi:transcriptional regulator with XRE-family HTH domain